MVLCSIVVITIVSIDGTFYAARIIASYVFFFLSFKHTQMTLSIPFCSVLNTLCEEVRAYFNFNDTDAVWVYYNKKVSFYFLSVCAERRHKRDLKSLLGIIFQHCVTSLICINISTYPILVIFYIITEATASHSYISSL